MPGSEGSAMMSTWDPVSFAAGEAGRNAGGEAGGSWMLNVDVK